MSPSSSRMIGGEYGEIRANIDVNGLNGYLRKCVKEVSAPVSVKQFKVRRFLRSKHLATAHAFPNKVWTGI